MNLRRIKALDPKYFHRLALATAILVFLVIVTGGMVQVTGSAGACLDLFDLAACVTTGSLSGNASAAIDVIHRLATFLVTPLLLAAAWVANRTGRKESWIRYPYILTLFLLAIQIVLGLFVFQGSGEWATALHLGLSLLVQAGVLVPVVLLFYQNSENSENKSMTLRFRSSFARLSLVTLSAVFTLLVSGAIVSLMQTSGAQAAEVCAGWPLCGSSILPADWQSAVHLFHRFSVLISGILLTTLLVQAWRKQRSQPVILVATTATFVLLVAQALLGAKLVDDFPIYLLALHQATAVAVFSALVVQVTAVGFAARSEAEEQQEAQEAKGRRGLAKDFLMLTKPIVVALLLVTTFAGMVIGAQSWPSLSVTIWTLLGGFMAAGGSGAINQYIDRYDDIKMQRTQNRPIPSGRLTPAEGLAFGVGIALASFYFMVAFVNFLAALLSLAGIIYYVLIYSIFLKKTTVQNIVIGGGAGAIPPLVGWAAATGHLNVPSFLLFAIIFMWTPPHFWALSIVRSKDYARAGVPMLPVVRGEKETRWQILIYTIELILLSLLLPLFGLGGSVYLIGAAVLGLWLLRSAWNVWRQEGNKVAWKMYRHSSMYLAFLFIVLMIDRLL